MKIKNNLVVALLFLITACHAQPKTSEIFAPEGKAIKGYDPVAFFKQQKPVMGTDSLVFTYKDARWFFSSRENLDAFKENPMQYAPQYGGYCAYGTSQGHKAPTETDTWTILNNKLYFNYNQDVRKKWMKDQEGYIKKADEQWPMIKDK